MASRTALRSRSQTAAARTTTAYLPLELRTLILARCKSTLLPIQRLSRRFAPTLKQENAVSGLSNASPAMVSLIRAGFLRQSSAGIYSLLPNGERVRAKLERIIDEELSRIGASKLALPNLLPSTLWEKSGRWKAQGSELFRLKDRKETELLLAPTHEEEITALVDREVTSWRQLPVKVYQVTRKFRDEARPRGGLLRGREFLMKDLYTFDASQQEAIASYNEARQAYDRIFQRIGLPFHVAQADSGSIGGPLSHEYQYKSSAGEDHLLACPSCGYTANEELAQSRVPANVALEAEVDAHPFDSSQTQELILVLTGKDRRLNPTKARDILAKATPIKESDGLRQLDEWDQLVLYIDSSLSGIDPSDLHDCVSAALKRIALGAAPHPQDDDLETTPSSVWPNPPQYFMQDLCSAQAGDLCVSCSKPLVKFPAIEVAHTFYLGTKYSLALNATFVPKPAEGESQKTAPPKPVHFEMGCFGIGMSRIIGAVADLCVDHKGLAWPAALSPYRLLVVALKPEFLDDISPELEHSGLDTEDVLFDDRFDLSFGQRMKDAELVGYSAVLVLGKTWEETGHWEVLFRRDESKVIFETKAEAVEAIMGAS